MLAFTLVTCLGVLFAPVSSAGDRRIKISYAGVGYETSFDPNGDGFPVGLSLTDARGTLGSAKLVITSE
jgi:hypothetical protein